MHEKMAKRVDLVIFVCALITVSPVTAGQGQSVVPHTYVEGWQNLGQRWSPQYQDEVRNLGALLYEAHASFGHRLWSAADDLVDDDTSWADPEALAMLASQQEVFGAVDDSSTAEVSTHADVATTAQGTSEIPVTTVVTTTEDKRTTKDTRTTKGSMTTETATTSGVTTTVGVSTRSEATTTVEVTTKEALTTRYIMTTTGATTAGVTTANATMIVVTTEAEATTPEVTTTAEATTTPEVTTTAEATTTPEVTTTAEATTTPEVTTTAEATTTPEVTTTTEVTTKAEDTTTAEVTTKADVTTTADVTTITPAPPPTLTPACKNATRELRAGLVSLQPWAVQMVDATGKLESGFMRGNVLWLGSYSECLDVQAYTNVTEPFKGKYCTVTIANMKDPKPVTFSSLPGITLGICFPNVCTTADTYLLIYKALHPRFPAGKIPLDVGAIASTCHTGEKPSLDSAAIGTICLLVFIGVVLLAATVYDLFFIQCMVSLKPVLASEDEGNQANGVPNGHYGVLEGDQDRTKAAAEGHQGILAMLMVNLSVYTNARKLLSTQRSAASLDALHGLRFFSMTWVLLGHTYFFLEANNVASNFADFFEIFKGFAFQAIGNAFVCVDSFFLLSGTLVSYLLLKELSRSDGPRHVNWALYYFHRFWRLTPPYMLVLGAHTALYQYTGEGPFWPTTRGGMEPTCHKDWWTNLLYLNTVLNDRMGCMGWAWYLANDMIYYVFSPIFVIAFYLNKYIGVALCSTGILVAILTNSITSAVHHCGPNNIYGPLYGHSCGTWDNDLYFKPQYRFGPYLIGLLLGYILYKAGRRVNLKWYVNAVGWVVATAAGLWVVYGLAGIPHGHLYTAAGNAAYQGLHRNVWAAAMGWVVFACCTGNGGPVNALLSWSPFMVLSRLTYMGYLIHPVIMDWYYQNLQDTIIFSHSTAVWLYLGFFGVVYALAFVFSLAFESPMMGLEKVVFRKKRE